MAAQVVWRYSSQERLFRVTVTEGNDLLCDLVTAPEGLRDFIHTLQEALSIGESINSDYDVKFSRGPFDLLGPALWDARDKQ